MKRFAMIRSGRIEDAGRDFDIEFWQRLGTKAIWDAAWDLVVTAHELKRGRRSDLKIQRVIKSFPIAHRKETHARMPPMKQHIQATRTVQSPRSLYRAFRGLNRNHRKNMALRILRDQKLLADLYDHFLIGRALEEEGHSIPWSRYRHSLGRARV